METLLSHRSNFKLIRTILLILFQVIFFSSAWANEENSTLSGIVVDADTGEGLANIRIVVEGTEHHVTSDETGFFKLTDLPDGSVVVVVDNDGFEIVRNEYSDADRQNEILLELTSKRVSLSSIEVSATEFEEEKPETASMTVLTPFEMSSAPVRSAEEVLRQVPGMTLVQHGSEGKGYQFFLRGFDAIHGADLELTLEGIPINEWSNIHAQGYLDLGYIIPDLIDSVTVTKGPFTVQQGAFAMAGSSDYKLRVPYDKVGKNVSYTVGSTNRHRVFASISPEDSGGDEFLAVDVLHDDGFGETRHIDRATFNGRTILPGSYMGGSLAVFSAISYAEFGLPTPLRNADIDDGFVDFHGSYDDDAEGDASRAVVSLHYQADHGEALISALGYVGYRDLRLRENFTGFLIDPVNGDRKDQQQNTFSFGLSGTYDVPLSDTVSLLAGTGLRGDNFRQSEDHVGRRFEVISETRKMKSTQMLGHALASFRWKPHPSVQVDAGGRVDVMHVNVTDQLQNNEKNSDTLSVFSPRFIARWDTTDQLSLFASYGRGFRPPEARAFTNFEAERQGISEDVFDGGEPTMTVSDSIELGGRWNPSTYFGASLTGFATFIERESIFDHVSGTNLELNGTRRLGTELVLDVYPTHWLTVSGDVTVVDASFEESGNKVPLVPELVAGLRMMANHPNGMSGGLRMIRVDPRPLPHGATGATLLSLDATFGYRWDGNKYLDIELENLLDRETREGEYHYASHWQTDQTASDIPELHTTGGAPFNVRVTFGLQF